MASLSPSPTNNLHMASISPSSYPSSLQMASVSPFPSSHCWDVTMWAQISGHSSVQSSSTLGLRKARQPIYILRFKKIEQGQLLYPKICPPIFLKTFQEKFTSPTRRVIFRYSFAKISLITYSQIQVRLKSQFFKEGIRMCEFSWRNMVKKYAESAVFTR